MCQGELKHRGPSINYVVSISTIYDPPSPLLSFFLYILGSFFKASFRVLPSSLLSFLLYSVSHIITFPSKELCSKMALGEVGVSNLEMEGQGCGIIMG